MEKSKNELDELGEKENRLLDLLVEGVISEDIYKQQIATIAIKKIELQESISKIQRPN